MASRTICEGPIGAFRPLCKVHGAAVAVVHFATWAGGSEWLPKLTSQSWSFLELIRHLGIIPQKQEGNQGGGIKSRHSHPEADNFDWRRLDTWRFAGLYSACEARYARA